MKPCPEGPAEDEDEEAFDDASDDLPALVFIVGLPLPDDRETERPALTTTTEHEAAARVDAIIG